MHLQTTLFACCIYPYCQKQKKVQCVPVQPLENEHGEVSSFKTPSHQIIGPINQPPSLFSKECFIKTLKASKTHSSIPLWLTQRIRFNSMNLVFSILTSPTELVTQYNTQEKGGLNCVNLYFVIFQFVSSINFKTVCLIAQCSGYLKVEIVND